MERVELSENDQLIYDVDSDEHSGQKAINRGHNDGSFKPLEKSRLNEERIREISFL